MMLSNIRKLVNKNKDTLLLIIIVFLACLLSFSLGWIIAKTGANKPIDIY
jgi:hypothetical protein